MTQPAATKQIRIWDPLVRAGHWLLVASVVLAWVTKHGGGVWHERLGYAALTIVAVRLVWGFTGPRHARFVQFLRTPAATLSYALQVFTRREPRYIGHNPLGGWLTVVLLLMVSLVGGSGWLYTTDRFWGVEWVGNLHEALSNLLVALVCLHLAGVALASWRHRENLVAAMIHGRKRAPRAEDID